MLKQSYLLFYVNTDKTWFKKDILNNKIFFVFSIVTKDLYKS